MVDIGAKDDEKKDDEKKDSKPKTTPQKTLPAWWDAAVISRTEQLSFARLLAATSDGQQRYLAIRNCILQLHAVQPLKFLSASACRAHISGDVAAIVEIHAFLEFWGIINAGVALPARRQAKFKVVTTEPLALGAPRSEAAPLKKQQQAAAAAAAASAKKEDSTQLVRTQLSTNEETTNQLRGLVGGFPQPYVEIGSHHAREAVLRAVLCSSCSKECEGSDELCYTTRQRPDVIICHACFVKGSYSELFVRRDFYKIDLNTLPSLTTPSDSYNDWTIEETEMLLSALQRHANDAGEKIDWQAIADFVDTDKTALHCMLQFVRLPFQDALINQYSATAMKTKAPSALAAAAASAASGSDMMNGDDHDDDAHDAEQDEDVPFEQAKNPIMAQVAFLAKTVSPQVAAAAAKVALEELTRASGGSGDLPSTTSQRTRTIATQCFAAATQRAAELVQHEEEELEAAAKQLMQNMINIVESKSNYLAKLNNWVSTHSAALRMEIKKLPAHTAEVHARNAIIIKKLESMQIPVGAKPKFW
jgi:hypothetical protein